MQIIAEASGVRKSYRLGETICEALRGVDLKVEKGEFLAVAGPSGSGKTTLLNILGCLDTATGGQVRLEGKDLSGLSPDRLAEIRRDKLGFVFQSFNLLPVLTAFENVEYPLLLQSVKAAERRRRVRELLAAVGLAEKMGNFPSQLSGGQQQRVSLARALAGRPALVLADEPTANLDSRTGEEIISLMRRLNKEQGVTFIFATHDRRIMEHASRLVWMEDGRITEAAG